jgi:hypothetical protein
MTTTKDEAERTSPLALWRYAHEYLSVAHNLCHQIHVKSVESQVPYHVAAQGIEFALKAYLRSRGATMPELHHDIGHSLTTALTRSEAQGLSPIPAPWREAIVALAPLHQNGQFVYRDVAEGTFPEIAPLIDSGVWILDRIAPDVVEHFVVHLATDATPPVTEFVRRLRGALTVISDITQPQAS